MGKHLPWRSHDTNGYESAERNGANANRYPGWRAKLGPSSCATGGSIWPRGFGPNLDRIGRPVLVDVSTISLAGEGMKFPVMNGSSSVVALIITGVAVIVCLIGLIVLSIDSKPIPELITYTLLACIGFIVGTRVSTPDVTNQIIKEHTEETTKTTPNTPTGLP